MDFRPDHERIASELEGIQKQLERQHVELAKRKPVDARVGTDASGRLKAPPAPDVPGVDSDLRPQPGA